MTIRHILNVLFILNIYIYSYLHRNSRSEIFMKISVLKNFINLTGKHLRWSETCIFFKKRLQHGCFPVKFVKFLRTSSFTDHFGGCSCLQFLIYTYLLILIYTYLSILKFSLYYHMNLIKLIKHGEYRNCDESFQIEEYFQY